MFASAGTMSSYKSASSSAILQVQKKEYFSILDNTTHAITFDTTPTEDNLLIFFVVTGANITSVPAGFDQAAFGSSFVNGYCYYKVAGGGESSTISIDTDVSDAMAIQCFEYSGTATTNASVFDQGDDATSVGAGTTIVSPTTAATAQADELLMVSAHMRSGDVLGQSVTSWTNSFSIENECTTEEAENANMLLNVASRRPNAIATYQSTGTITTGGLGFDVCLIVAFKALLDSDAQAFITAAAITDNTQKTAINTLVLAAKANGWWTLCNAIYPMVGGVDSSHKFNLKDPQDTDAAFRLTFTGSLTHSSTGILPDGSTGYANTFLSPSTTLSTTSLHLGTYSRSNIASSGTAKRDIGSASGSGNCFSAVRNSSDLATISLTTTSTDTFANADSRGFFLATRTASNAQAAYRNGSSLGSNSGANGNLPSSTILLHAINNGGTPITFSDRELAFATIGAGIDSIIQAAMYTDIQAFQTTLGRQV